MKKSTHSALNSFVISFEGTEGSGKSTLIREVGALLNQLGQPSIQTREPGGSILAEKIRNLILESSMNPWTELFLYEAARAEHLNQTILPALERGEIVLCDRFTDSTLAYQGHARGLPWNQIKILNKIATAGIRPRLTVFLDIDPEVGLRRAKDPNRFEAEGVHFQQKVRKGFLKARAERPNSWLTLRSDKLTAPILAKKVVNHLITKRWIKKRE
ncbi:MAG: dTMP kinase [Bdellovibrionia bacterium]